MVKVRELPADAVEETQIRRRVIPAADSEEKESRTPQPDAFDYMADPRNWDSSHIVYIYREDPRRVTTGEAVYDEVSPNPITLEYVREKWGGRVFRIIVKKGSSRVSDKRYSIDLPAKYPQDSGAAVTAAAPHPNGPGTNDVVRSVLEGQPAMVAASVGIMQNAANTAMEMVRNAVPPVKAEPDALDQLEKAKRILTPMQSAMPARDPFMDKILERIVDKMFAEPAAAAIAPAAPAKSLVDTLREIKELAGLVGYVPAGAAGGGENSNVLVSLAPLVIDGIKEVSRNFAIAMQAQAAARAGQPPPRAVNAPGAPAPGVQRNPAPAPTGTILPMPPIAAAPAPTAQSATEEIVRQVQQRMAVMDEKLVEIVTPLQPGDETRTAPGSTDGETVLAAAAQRAIDFLDECDPTYISNAVNFGLERTLMFLQGDPGLAAIHQHAMLRPFVAKVIELAKEPEQPPLAAVSTAPQA